MRPGPVQTYRAPLPPRRSETSSKGGPLLLAQANMPEQRKTHCAPYYVLLRNFCWWPLKGPVPGLRPVIGLRFQFTQALCALWIVSHLPSPISHLPSHLPSPISHLPSPTPLCPASTTCRYCYLVQPSHLVGSIPTRNAQSPTLLWGPSSNRSTRQLGSDASVILVVSMWYTAAERSVREARSESAWGSVRAQGPKSRCNMPR